MYHKQPFVSIAKQNRMLVPNVPTGMAEVLGFLNDKDILDAGASRRGPHTLLLSLQAAMPLACTAMHSPTLPTLRPGEQIPFLHPSRFPAIDVSSSSPGKQSSALLLLRAFQ